LLFSFSFGSLSLSDVCSSHTLYHIKWTSFFSFSISNFHHAVNVVCFLLGDSQASEFCMPMYQNTPSVPSS
jgi:hypothetical protein